VLALAIGLCCVGRSVALRRRRRRIAEAIENGIILPEHIEALKKGDFSLVPMKPPMFEVRIVQIEEMSKNLDDISVSDAPLTLHLLVITDFRSQL
jgi:hypothetical protein